MEKDLERYYSDFKRPPFAPTYHPTEEEFADPISYVAKIRPEAQQFGLIKIIPPPSFRPPFCIDSAKFEFVPRVQRLNEVDALFRLRIIFINKLVHFWKYSKDQQFRIPYIDNKYIDLYRLRQLVEEEGGLKRVNDTRRWAHLAKSLGFRGNAGQTLKQCYTRWIHPFELSVANKEQQQQQQQGESSTTKKHGGPGIGRRRPK
uniref:ARID domain-containing protein n=1 Tax=Globodera pallida TaxID=36090 RepID=A0A183CK89_GLOPA